MKEAPADIVDQDDALSADTEGHILTDSIKIVIEPDPTCNTGTKFQYILTRDSFMHVYRKNGLLTRDTIMGACDLPADDRLDRIMNIRFGELEGPAKNSECRLVVTYFRKNYSKTVIVDATAKNPAVAMTIAYINYLMAGSDKYTIAY